MERRDDLATISSCSDQHLQQNPGFERPEEAGIDQPAILEITLGTWETIGSAEHWTGAGARGEYHRDVRGEFGKRRHERGRNMSHPKSGDDHAIETGTQAT
jgi:hypothetical protein